MPTRRSTLTRRALIAGGGLLGCCVAVSAGGAATFFLANQPTSNLGDLDFATPLDIPPLLEGEPDEDGRIVFDLSLQTGRTRIVPAGEAETWGVNGPFLGPTLQARRGDTVMMNIRNGLPEETTIHWHGMHLPAAMDGGPHQMIAEEDTWSPEWKIAQPAATLWYHPHPHGKTAEHVYRGVAGFLLIEDDESEELDLPHDYGIDDIPLIIQDKAFTDNGDLSLDAGSFLDRVGGSANFGLLGDTILVNGTFDPYLEVTRSLVRFRILNGSNARFYNLGFEDDRAFRLVATDNGFVPGEPLELTRLLLGPGERAEVVVAFAPGEQAVFRSFETGLGRQIGGEDTFDIIQFRAADHLDEAPPLPRQTGYDGGVPDVPGDVTERDFELDGHNRINGEEMDMTRIDLAIPAGALEVWNVRTNGQPHTFHIHGATFHVLEVDGDEPPPYLRGPKDTVFVGPDHPVTLAVRFGTHTDPETPYMYHCHILKHEDNGMMGQFVVVEPGTEGDTPTTIESHLQH